jgi:tRNA (guanine37-N1)-methyltransferase
MSVPDVLVSGDHKKIEEWRRDQSFRRTLLRRSDLIDHDTLSEQEKEIIEETKK